MADFLVGAILASPDRRLAWACNNYKPHNLGKAASTTPSGPVAFCNPLNHGYSTLYGDGPPLSLKSVILLRVRTRCTVREMHWYSLEVSPAGQIPHFNSKRSSRLRPVVQSSNTRFGNSACGARTLASDTPVLPTTQKTSVRLCNT
jgi:hypothetical protein